jgi:hypothetical protein
MAKSHSNEDFIISRHPVKCKNCGSTEHCIKEPKDTAEWECRTCYTGLTTEQIQEKFNQIWEMIKRKKLDREINYRSQKQNKAILDEQKKAIA